LRVASGIALAEVLRGELLDFRAKTNQRTAHTSFNARVGAHDDVLISVAIACWLGSRHEIAYRPGAPADAGRCALDSEIERDRAAFEAERRAESERRQAEWMNPNNPVLWDRIF
jgi:hypothetical protein